MSNNEEQQEQDATTTTTTTTTTGTPNLEIKELKEQLLDREARLMAMQQQLNEVLTNANINASTLYREINKNLVVMSDMILSVIQPELQQRLNSVRTQLTREQKIQLSNSFRTAEGVTPLGID